jgi:hypothetical protein
VKRELPGMGNFCVETDLQQVNVAGVLISRSSADSMIKALIVYRSLLPEWPWPTQQDILYRQILENAAGEASDTGTTPASTKSGKQQDGLSAPLQTAQAIRAQGERGE